MCFVVFGIFNYGFDIKITSASAADPAMVLVLSIGNGSISGQGTRYLTLDELIENISNGLLYNRLTSAQIIERNTQIMKELANISGGNYTANEKQQAIQAATIITNKTNEEKQKIQNYQDAQKTGTEEEKKAAEAALSSDAHESNAAGSAFDIIADIVGWIFYYVFVALAWIVTQLVWVMLKVMTYPIDINNTRAVVQGWEVVRNLCNNFFIVILMIAAIGTIVGHKSYSIKSMLPKLLMAAILINFSKMLVGIAIDISQVIMLAFASSFANVEGGNIVLSAIGFPDLLKLVGNGAGTSASAVSDGRFGGWSVITALLYGIIVAIIIMIVVVVIIAILIARIVALLFLTVLSPLFFFGKAFAAVEKKTNEWIGEFTKYLIIGPTLLFFLWLSFMMMGYGQSDPQKLVISNTSDGEPITISDEQLSSLSEAMSLKGMINTALVIGMLCYTLVIAKKSGVAGASLGASALGSIQKAAKKPMNWGKGLGKWGLNATTRATGLKALNQGFQGYMKARQSKIAEGDAQRAKDWTGRFSNAEKAVKETAAKPFKWAGEKIKEKTWGRKAKDIQSQIEDGDSRLDRIKAEGTYKSIEDHKDFTANGVDYKFDAASNSWGAQMTGTKNVVGYSLSDDQLFRMTSAVNSDGHIDDIDKHNDFVDDVNGDLYKYDAASKQWRVADSGGHIVASAMNDDDLKQYRNEIAKIENGAKGSVIARGDDEYEKNAAGDWVRLSDNKSFNKDEFYKELGGVTQSDVDLKREELNKTKEEEAAFEKKWRKRLLWGGAVLGAATGGIGWGGVGLVAGAALGMAAPATAMGAGRAIGQAGSTASDIALDNMTQQLEAARKDMKDLKNKDLMAKVDDYTLNKFERMAASMEAISRGILTEGMARRKSDEVVALGRNEDKIKDMVDKELTKNYIGLSETFQKLKDPAKHDGALLKIRDQILNGKLVPKDLDPGSLGVVAGEFAEQFKTGKFVSTFKDLTQPQQAAIKKSLIDAGASASDNQKEKLASIADIGVAYGAAPASGSKAEEQRNKFISKLSTKDIVDMIESNDKDKVEALKTALAGSDALLSDSVKAALKGGSGRATMIKDALKV